MAQLAIINGYDIRDRKLADATIQTTVGDNDYVMVEDYNGNYTKILKENFSGAVRECLGKLLNGNDKGTTIDKVACLGTSSHDFGSITTANLASVLGGKVSCYTNGNFNNINTYYLYIKGDYRGGCVLFKWSHSNLLMFATFNENGASNSPTFFKYNNGWYVLKYGGQEGIITTVSLAIVISFGIVIIEGHDRNDYYD